MSKNVGTLVIATVRPYDSLDTYASAVANEVQGGHHQVADITARNAITTQRRVEGMLVYVISVDTTYRLVGGLTNDKWVEISGGLSSFFTLEASRNFYVTNSYLSAHDLATNLVPIILPSNAKLVAMSIAMSAPSVWTAEVRKSGTLVPGATLTVSGGDLSAYSNTYNINFDAGDGLQIFCNGTSVHKPRVNLWLSRR